jgi:polyhydroxyalkanoate synthesis regulator phasin
LIQNEAREFLVRLMEVNSTRVQSDILNRIQESHLYLEVEIRRLLHEVSRVAEQALRNARRLQQEGASAVAAAQERIAALERQVTELGCASSLPCTTE